MVVDPVYIAVFLVVATLLLIAIGVRKKNGKVKAPQPLALPIIGHLHLLLGKQPIHRKLAALSKPYGEILYLQLGSCPTLIVSSPRLAKECFTTNGKVFSSRPNNAAGKILGFDFQMVGMAPYGPYWRNIRKICTMELFSATRIESFKHIRVEESSALIRSLLERCSLHEQGKSTENIRSWIAELMFNISLRTVASKRSSSSEAQHFKEMLVESSFLTTAVNVGDFLPFLRRFDLNGVEARMKKAAKKRDDLMAGLVRDHREKRRIQLQAPQTEEAKDLIDVLLFDENLSESEVKSVGFNMIQAGTDTPYVTVEWALTALLRHPSILKKAQEELDTHIGRDRIVEESDLDKLKYLEAIVKESLRLYPTVPFLCPRLSLEACTVGGYYIPAGTQLIVNGWAIHRDPALWERPTEFDPERFLKSEREINIKGHDFELLPFGSGRRICMGMNLAMRLVPYTLARLLQSFEWSVPEGTEIDMTEGHGFLMYREFPLEATVKPRLPLHLY